MSKSVGSAGAAGFGRRLFEARKALEVRLGRTVPHTEMGGRLGVHGVTYGGWENGKSQPSLDMIAKLAEALDVQPAWLAFGEGTREAAPVTQPTGKATVSAERSRGGVPSADVARPARQKPRKRA